MLHFVEMLLISLQDVSHVNENLATMRKYAAMWCSRELWTLALRPKCPVFRAGTPQ